MSLMTKPPAVTRDALEAKLRGSPFQQSLGLSLEQFDAAAQTLSLRAAYGPQVERAVGTGQYHGGVIASLIDIAGDFALIAVLGYAVPTINFRVDYLRPARLETLDARAHVVRQGNRVGVVDVVIFHPSTATETIATGKAVYNIVVTRAPS